MCAQPVKSRLGLKIAIVLLVLGATGLVAFNHFRATAVVSTVKRGTAADLVTGSVVVHAQKDLQDIKSELPGRVAWIDSRQLGELFKAGEPILKLDSSELERAKKEKAEAYQAEVEAARIKRKTDPRLEEAKEKLANAEKEHNRGDLSDSQWRAAQRAYSQVETELELLDFSAQQAKRVFENDQAALQRQIDRMTIRAPMDCILHDVFVAVGSLIGASTTVATYFAMDRVVIAKVGEEDIGRVKIGQPAKVRLLNLGGDTFDATVTTILPYAEADTQRYSVYLEVKTNVQNLKPFSTGEATITVGERANQPLIARRALFNDDQVLVVRNGVIEKRKVSVGFRALNYAEVTDKLTEGEQVIVDEIDQFRDGQRVRTVEAP